MRFALRPPSYCAACFGQYPDRLHIDFEASWDGPVVEVANGLKVTIDDLIICENCLKGAASLFKLVDADELRSENVDLGELVENLQKQLALRDDTIADLAEAVKRLRDETIKRSDGRHRKLGTNEAVDRAEKVLAGNV